MQSPRSTAENYARLGLGARQRAGRRPALVVVDLCYGFTDPASPLHCGADDALAATASLLRRARDAARPIAYTTVSYDDAGRHEAEAFLAKVPALAMLRDGSRWPRIDDRIAPREGEPVLRKLFASGFFDTELHALLTTAGCDTVLLCGASTSGCVRATAVDALQHGYRVLVCREAVCDRDPGAHAASLTDIDAKYGDVIGLDAALALLGAAEPPA
jgi:nicotinamidase-related amidase